MSSAHAAENTAGVCHTIQRPLIGGAERSHWKGIPVPWQVMRNVVPDNSIALVDPIGRDRPRGIVGPTAATVGWTEHPSTPWLGRSFTIAGAGENQSHSTLGKSPPAA